MATPQSEPLTPSSPPRRVLIVDDSVDGVQASAMLLKLAGHETAVATSGQQALDMLGSFRPQVVLIEIGMPDIDGYELARRIRAAAGAAVRLVAVSGYDRELEKSAGVFDDCVVKPASASDIARAIAG